MEENRVFVLASPCHATGNFGIIHQNFFPKYTKISLNTKPQWAIIFCAYLVVKRLSQLFENS